MLLNNNFLLSCLLLWLRFFWYLNRVKIFVFVQIWLEVWITRKNLFFFSDILRRNFSLFANCFTIKQCNIFNIMIFIIFVNIKKYFYSFSFLKQLVQKKLTRQNLYKNLGITCFISLFFKLSFVKTVNEILWLGKKNCKKRYHVISTIVLGMLSIIK